MLHTLRYCHWHINMNMSWNNETKGDNQEAEINGSPGQASHLCHRFPKVARFSNTSWRQDWQKVLFIYRPSALSTTSSASVGLPRKNYGSTTCRFSFWTKQSGRPDFSNYFLNVQGVAMPFLTAALQRPQTHSWWDPKIWMFTLWNFWSI